MMDDMTLIGGPLISDKYYREDMEAHAIRQVIYEFETKDVENFVGWSLEIVDIVPEHILSGTPDYAGSLFDDFKNINLVDDGQGIRWGILGLNFSQRAELMHFIGGKRLSSVELRFRYRDKGNLVKMWSFYGATLHDNSSRRAEFVFSDVLSWPIKDDSF